MTISKHLCIIPAKAASTRLKKKNILPLGGKPILHYPIEAALNSQLFDKIIVSTESKEVASIARTKPVSVHIRPEKMAHDPYGVVDVILELLDAYPDYKEYEHITILLATSPLIESEDIQQAYKEYKANNFSALMSVAKTAHNAYRAISLNNDRITAIFPENLRKKSQELEPTYHINAAITIVDTKKFLQEKSYFLEPLGAYVLSEDKAVDIDTEFDYNFAQFLLSQKHALSEES